MKMLRNLVLKSDVLSICKASVLITRLPCYSTDTVIELLKNLLKSDF